MSASLWLYRLKDFIRLTESGEIDVGRSKEIVHELVVAAHFHVAHNILIDLRSSIEHHTIGDHMELALEFARYRLVFTGRIAFLFPDDPERLASATEFLACLDMVGCRFQTGVFTDFEGAIDWLGDAVPCRNGKSQT